MGVAIVGPHTQVFGDRHQLEVAQAGTRLHQPNPSQFRHVDDRIPKPGAKVVVARFSEPCADEISIEVGVVAYKVELVGLVVPVDMLGQDLFGELMVDVFRVGKRLDLFGRAAVDLESPRLDFVAWERAQRVVEFIDQLAAAENGAGYLDQAVFLRVGASCLAIYEACFHWIISLRQKMMVTAKMLPVFSFVDLIIVLCKVSVNQSTVSPPYFKLSPIGFTVDPDPAISERPNMLFDTVSMMECVIR